MRRLGRGRRELHCAELAVERVLLRGGGRGQRQKRHSQQTPQTAPSAHAQLLKWTQDVPRAGRLQAGEPHWRRPWASCSKDAMVEGTPKPDGYIAVRRAELAEGIAAADGLPDGEVGAFGDVLKLLDALLQYEAHEQ